jgi:hypothetical protein
MTAARSAPRSDPANNHDFRPSAKSREQGAFRGVVVAEADAAVFKEANEGRPTCEHVEAPLLAGRQAFGGGRAVDLALAVEERVDTSDGLQRDRRDRRRRLAPSSVGGDISQLEEFPPRVAPAQRLDDRTRRPVGKIEAIVAVTGGLAFEPHVSAISGSRSRVHRNDA